VTRAKHHAIPGSYGGTGLDVAQTPKNLSVPLRLDDFRIIEGCFSDIPDWVQSTVETDRCRFCMAPSPWKVSEVDWAYRGWLSPFPQPRENTAHALDALTADSRPRSCPSSTGLGAILYHPYLGFWLERADDGGREN
jgi:hypothetical protein